MNDRFSEPRHIKWAKEVKERDCYECLICGQNGGELNSHHMDSFDVFIDKRFDVDNGATLCFSCHNRFHNIYGHSCNTRHQFEEFKAMMRLIDKLVNKI